MGKDILLETIIKLISDQSDLYDRLNFPIAGLTRDDDPLATILGAFIYIKFSEGEARRHWEAIIRRHSWLKEQIDGAITIHTSVYDYFLNQTDILKNPLLIDTNLFNMIKQYAVIDGLSGVFNRNYFELVLKKELKRAMRYNKVFTLVILDIDNFKRVNDLNGHLFGDTVIKNLAILLKDACREEDIICRYGGDEFIFFLPETPSVGALNFGERIRAMIKADRFFKSHDITVSGGISEYPHDGSSIMDLMKSADDALYKSKADGKDRIEIFKNNRRKYPRYAKAYEILFKPLEKVFIDGMNKELVTEDISLSGLRCILPEDYKPDTELVLSFKMLNMEAKRIITLGKIVWSKQIDHSHFMYGVKFQPFERIQIEQLLKLFTEK
jgi:two-component system, cell cycle response regulator